MASNEDKINFCVRYLDSQGVSCNAFECIRVSLDEKPVVDYVLVRQDDSFFTRVAEGLREMWPAGNKDEKWAWRSSVKELVGRLKFIWAHQCVTDDYSVEDCLEAGRKYLARFQHGDTKYMKILKYFIFKQKTAGVTTNGMYKMEYESPLLNILQDKKEEQNLEALLEGEII